MIYHKYKIHFIGIPKNASTSVHTMLSNKTDIHHTHATYMEDYFSNDEQLIESYQSLAVVRNPYDRLVSNYTYNTQHGRIITEFPQIDSFSRFVQALYYYEFPDLMLDPSMHPQYRFISLHKHVLIDHILRYETLEEDWKKFATEYNSKSENKFKLSTQLVKRNLTDGRTADFMSLYNRNTLKMVNELFIKDFELFGYDMK